MIDWLQNPDYAQGEAATLFGDIDRVFSLTGELITQDSLSCMLRVTVGSQRYYVKRYSGSGKNHRRRWFGLRRWFGSPRVRAEWQNLLAFRSWGIPTATLVAYGLERRGGAFTRGAVVTAEIPDSMDLAQINYVNDPRLSDRRWVARVSGKVADIARTLHAARFAHNDLKWRNLLVDGEATVYLIDCPSGGYYRGAFLDYRIIKDLACLDIRARQRLSRSQRLRFYLDYAQRSRLTDEDRKRIRKIVRFFDGRR
ncbi:lipopolysaccharide kinase InaA family protein [Accumulibacter sp.]|uniref:lipopolysaccharide kinase InaA family protein n=1 Tax=Accumulibacter sp. TaxID=2053492 RepID=UPI001DD31B52|nr:lipopolysaccharide kinase InaA family protein [Accumulibacter sp.]MCB1967893.1 heptose kinase [Accumulibacter sp.]MCP5228750.1 heptose kinase [Accumulibacter sp.]